MFLGPVGVVASARRARSGVLHRWRRSHRCHRHRPATRRRRGSAFGNLPSAILREPAAPGCALPPPRQLGLPSLRQGHLRLHEDERGKPGRPQGGGRDAAARSPGRRGLPTAAREGTGHDMAALLESPSRPLRRSRRVVGGARMRLGRGVRQPCGRHGGQTWRTCASCAR